MRQGLFSLTCSSFSHKRINPFIKMSESEIKNVLVLGTSIVEHLHFIKLFEGYLQYNSYEEASSFYMRSEHEDVTSYSMLIKNQNFNFICAPNLNIKCVAKQIVSTLSFFIQEQPITAIIFLVKPTDENNEYVLKYKSCLLSKLQDVKNVLNIFILNKNEQSTRNSFGKQKNEFYLQEDTFYTICKDNWIESTNFCKEVFHYIMGEGNISGLQDICIKSVMPKKSVLKLSDDLLELLIQIYISIEYSTILFDAYEDDDIYFGFIITEYKNNVMTCYGNNCIEWKQHDSNMDLKIKIPKICTCPESSKCTMSESTEKTCFFCKCGIDSHSKHYFKYDQSCPRNLDNEKHIAINNLATFLLYKRQNEEIYNFENIFKRVLDLENKELVHKHIFFNFKRQLNEEVQKLETKCKCYKCKCNKCNLVTEEDILKCLKDLHQIKVAAIIMPQFLNEIFSKDFQLEIITDERKESNIDSESNINEKMEIEMLRQENAELKHMLQNANNSNSKCIQDKTKRRKLNQTEKGSEEEEANRNIEATN